MSDYGNYSSDDASNDEIGFPKTPGQPLVAHQSEDNESSKSSSEAINSDSEPSDHENDAKQKSDSDDDDKKSSSAAEQDSEPENKSNDSSDIVMTNSESDSDNENSKPGSPKNERIQSDNENSNPKGDSDSYSDEEVVTRKRRVSSGSESEASNDAEPESRKRKQQSLDSSDESDQEGGDQGNKDTTAKDLFGDLSDEEEENKSDAEQRNDSRKKARIEDDDDDESLPANNDVVKDIFGADDDEEEEEEKVAENIGMDEEEEEQVTVTKIDTEMPRISLNLGQDGQPFHLVKLPNFLSIETHPYDPQTYEDEICDDDRHDDEGRARLKLKVENTIRWRNVTDEDGNTSRETNTRIVKWSDGSSSLYLGDEIFDIQTLNLQPGENNHLFIRNGTGLLGQAIFKTKLAFRPFSTESFTHRKLTLSLADRSQKTQKICILPSVGKNPEAHRSEMIKKEEDKLKASIRKESKTRRVKDRVYNRGLNSGYLENDDEDDESISISKIKNQYKNGPAYSGTRSSSNESDEQSDDDSEEDIFEKKKHTEKRKIVDSDDDD